MSSRRGKRFNFGYIHLVLNPVIPSPQSLPLKKQSQTKSSQGEDVNKTKYRLKQISPCVCVWREKAPIRRRNVSMHNEKLLRHFTFLWRINHQAHNSLHVFSEKYNLKLCKFSWLIVPLHGKINGILFVLFILLYVQFLEGFMSGYNLWIQ